MLKEGELISPFFVGGKMLDDYKNLGYAVLRAAVLEYFRKLTVSKHKENAERELIIDDVWFDITGVNREWFMEKVHKRGEEIWQKEQVKKNI